MLKKTYRVIIDAKFYISFKILKFEFYLVYKLYSKTEKFSVKNHKTNKNTKFFEHPVFN